MNFTAEYEFNEAHKIFYFVEPPALASSPELMLCGSEKHGLHGVKNTTDEPTNQPTITVPTSVPEQEWWEAIIQPETSISPVLLTHCSSCNSHKYFPASLGKSQLFSVLHPQFLNER